MSVTELGPSVLMLSLYFIPTEPGLLVVAYSNNHNHFITSSSF